MEGEVVGRDVPLAERVPSGWSGWRREKNNRGREGRRGREVGRRKEKRYNGGKGRRQKGREKRIVAGYPHLDSESLELKAGFFFCCISHMQLTTKENSHNKMYPEEHLCS